MTGHTAVERGASAPPAPAGQVAGPRAFLEQTRRERLIGAMWSLARVLLFRLSPARASAWRRLVLRCFGAAVGRRCAIHPSVRIDFPWNLTLGDDVVIEHGSVINCMGTITIGDRSRLSQYAHLCAGTHDYRRREMSIIRAPITIGRNVWIAADAFVGPGVSIGSDSLLAARSSAFADLPANRICVGEPARPRKPRFAAHEEA